MAINGSPTAFLAPSRAVLPLRGEQVPRGRGENIPSIATAYKERRKIHDIVLEGIELALRKRGRRS